MKQSIFTVKENNGITPGIFKMVLEGDTSAITAPGQFVNIKLAGKYLRRPISVCDSEPGSLTLIYKLLGEGTADMSLMAPGTDLDILTGLGNGYDLRKAGRFPLVIGGGVGVPPMYKLTKELLGDGRIERCITVVLGFNTASEVFLEKEFRDLVHNVIVTTVDGSYGIKGYVTTPLDKVNFTDYYACGPLPMLKAVRNALGEECGQLSLEERMGCGFGACMGCSIKVKGGYKRVCKDGPVFSSSELLWESE